MLVGASDVPGTLGDVLRRNLERAGFKGEVRYVNPGHAEIAGRAAWPSVRDLPGPPADLAIIATPALDRARRHLPVRRKGRQGSDRGVGGLPGRR